MGTIDSATITLTCTPCGTSEADQYVDGGNRWGGSSWTGGRFATFDVTVTGSLPDVSANCRLCGTTAGVEIRYGG